MTSIKRYIVSGQRVAIKLPWSEVCLSMRVADRTMNVELLDGGRAQIHTADGPFSFPILASEAGFSRDASGYYVLVES